MRQEYIDITRHILRSLATIRVWETTKAGATRDQIYTLHILRGLITVATQAGDDPAFFTLDRLQFHKLPANANLNPEFADELAILRDALYALSAGGFSPMHDENDFLEQAIGLLEAIKYTPYNAAQNEWEKNQLKRIEGVESFDLPLWHVGNKPTLNELHGMRQLGMGSEWSFWRDWYQGFLDGKPLDWELQRSVALIPDEDWEKGPEHIAQKIEEIRKEFEAPIARETERHPELEPPSLENVLRAPSISAAQVEAAAQDIKEAECKYLNDTGANQLPEQFDMLPQIAYSLSVIGTQIRRHETDPSVEEGLRQEVGRLNARILELETQLQTLQSSNDPVFTPAFKEQAGKSLGDWKMYGAMLGAVWLMSGDTVGMQTRLENLGVIRDSLFGTHSPAPIEPIQTLPESTDV